MKDLKCGSSEYVSKMTERNIPDTGMIKEMSQQALLLGFPLPMDSISVMTMSSCSMIHKEAHTWLSAYVELVGDKQPNRKMEIHLEYRTKYEIYLEYCDEAKSILKSIPISYSSFVELWSRCFSHVHIRKYKAVEGKCITCAVLTQMRSSARTVFERHEFIIGIGKI